MYPEELVKPMRNDLVKAGFLYVAVLLLMHDLLQK